MRPGSPCWASLTCVLPGDALPTPPAAVGPVGRLAGELCVGIVGRRMGRP